MPFAIDIYEYSHTEYAYDEEEASSIEDYNNRVQSNLTVTREISEGEYQLEKGE